MRFLHTLLLVVAALTSVNSAEIQYVNHESRSTLPSGWSLHSDTVPSDHQLSYRIAIKQNPLGVQQLESYLMDHSSNPLSDKFGVHLTRAEVDELTHPLQQSIDSVVEWLSLHGIESHQLQHTANSDFISFTAPVSVGNKLLNTQYKIYKHHSGQYTVRTTEYNVPVHITEHIDYIHPAIQFPRTSQAKLDINSVDSVGNYHPLTKHIQKKQPGQGYKKPSPPKGMLPCTRYITMYSTY